jgi:hypothetical protein
MGVGRLRSVRVNRRGSSSRIVSATFRGSGGRNRLHGYMGIRARLALRDAPSTIKRITSRGSTARAAVSFLGSHALAREVFGSVSPGEKGTAVVVQRRTEGEWERVGRTRLGRSGRYRLTVDDGGLYRVVSAGDAGPAIRIR